MGVKSLPKTVTRQHRHCDFNPDRSAPESSTLTTRLPSHPTTITNTNLRGRRSSSDHSINAARSLLRSDAAGRYGSKGGCYRRDRQTDGRTPNRYIESAPHTMRAASKTYRALTVTE